MYIYMCVCVCVLAAWLECSLMAQETGVHSQVESYQRLKKWYLIPPCLTLSIIRYGSRVKSNPRKGVAPFPTPRFVAIEKDPSGHPRQSSPTLLTYYYVSKHKSLKIMKRKSCEAIKRFGFIYFFS